jgi:hypothetical protein
MLKDLGRQIVEVFTLNKKISLILLGLGFLAGKLL